MSEITDYDEYRDMYETDRFLAYQLAVQLAQGWDVAETVDGWDKAQERDGFTLGPEPCQRLQPLAPVPELPRAGLAGCPGSSSTDSQRSWFWAKMNTQACHAEE